MDKLIMNSSFPIGKSALLIKKNAERSMGTACAQPHASKAKNACAKDRKTICH